MTTIFWNIAQLERHTADGIVCTATNTWKRTALSTWQPMAARSKTG